jgi:hypothetical protein
VATVADVIRGTLRLLGVLASGETPKAADEADALVVLNDMLDSWAGERLALFATLRSTHVLTGGLSPHTIGSGGTFNTTRPVRIDRASIKPGGSPGSELPLELLTDAEWQGRQGKEDSARPTALWVENSHPLMKLHFQPVPVEGDSIILYTWSQLGRFAATSTDFDLPPGYARAIRFNLAKELAPEYGVALSGEAMETANESKATIKRLNQKPSLLRCDPAVRAGSSSSSIIAGFNGSDTGGLY